MKKSIFLANFILKKEKLIIMETPYTEDLKVSQQNKNGPSKLLVKYLKVNVKVVP